MRRLQRLGRLQRFLETMRLDGWPELRPVMVVSAGDATKHLGGGVVGPQLLAAFPEESQSGDVDSRVSRISTVLFVLDKDLESARTVELERGQYARLLEMADAVVSAVESALTEPLFPGCTCPPLAGLDLVSVDVVPELSLFGGWNGYSIEMVFS